MTNMEPFIWAAVLVEHRNSTARLVRPAVAGDHIANNDGADHIAHTPMHYFGPETVDSIYQEAGRALQCRREGQAIYEYFAEFDLLLRKDVSKM